MDFRPTPRTPTDEPPTAPRFSGAHLLIKMTSRKFLVTVGVVVGCLAKLLTGTTRGDEDAGEIDRWVQIFCAAGAIAAPLVYVLLEGLIDREERRQYLREHEEEEEEEIEVDIEDIRRQFLNQLRSDGNEPEETRFDTKLRQGHEQARL